MQITDTLHKAPVSDAGQANRELEVHEGSSREAEAQRHEQLKSAALDDPMDPDVRMHRVREIQDALAAGTYNVSASEVAAKIMKHMLEK